MSQTMIATPFAFEQKLQAQHRERLAVVYVRQSTIQQVRHNRGSTELQYDLVHLAERFAWPRERIVVIDDDLGISAASAEGRHGFQRLLSEVALNHVGLILGVEMSRLARSCKDWYQLLEVCALFRTLICDLDGMYDPSNYNDRLLLGLKGTMSEAELHIIRQRMQQGALRKARKGELRSSVPIGYVLGGDGEVLLDPDEQVQLTVRTVFQDFERIGSVGRTLMHLNQEGVRLPIRVRVGPDKGTLQWRRPQHGTLLSMLRNPTYAGAYSYGRSRMQKQPNGHTRRHRVKYEEWQVLLRDRHPAYISWSQFEQNGTQLTANRSLPKTPGSVRKGSALVAGLLVCGRCGARLRTWYGGNGNKPRYGCVRARNTFGDPECQSIMAQPLDVEVARLTLLALAPAAVDVSLRVASDIQGQHEKTLTMWRQKLERAQYEVDRARRQYDLVEPENRLVARTLESAWEEKLGLLRDLETERDRFYQQRPNILTAEEQDRIQKLASDLPMLWNAATTTDADRKTILRHVIEKIVINVEGMSEWVEARIHWLGGNQTYTRFRRPISRIDRLSNWPQIRQRISEMKEAGLSIPQIVNGLNQEGLRPPTNNRFTRQAVTTWLSRYGLTKARRPKMSGKEPLADNERFLSDLIRDIGIPYRTIYSLIRAGKIEARQIGGRNGQWVVKLDDKTRLKLRETASRSKKRALADPANNAVEHRFSHRKM